MTKNPPALPLSVKIVEVITAKRTKSNRDKGVNTGVSVSKLYETLSKESNFNEQEYLTTIRECIHNDTLTIAADVEMHRGGEKKTIQYILRLAHLPSSYAFDKDTLALNAKGIEISRSEANACRKELKDHRWYFKMRLYVTASGTPRFLSRL